MKPLFVLLVTVQSLMVTACSKDDTRSNTPTNHSKPESHTIKGRVTDSKGFPIANARVVVEHTVLYATYVYATTNKDGYYSATVPNGSWKASVQIERDFLGHRYRFDLHPDNDSPFAGKDGAIRNFSWKLSGQKPGGGFYGSSIAVYPEPGSSILMENIELTLKPEGPLADGSNGAAITAKLFDIGGGEDGISDIPIGRYAITAKDKSSGQLLEIRLRNTGDYGNSVTAIFKPGFTGSTGYQIMAQVK